MPRFFALAFIIRGWLQHEGLGAPPERPLIKRRPA